MTLSELAQKLNLEYIGNEKTEILGIKDIERLMPNSNLQNNYIYVVESENLLKKHPQIKNASAVLCPRKIAENFSNALISESENLRLKFIELLSLFEKKVSGTISPKNAASIDNTAQIDDTAVIMPGAVIMQSVKIGKNSIIYPNAVIEPYAQIGDNSEIHSCVVISRYCVIGNNTKIFAGAVIGADGFGYYDHTDGSRHKIPQIGNVIIGDFVEIGANSTIDRATIESTTVGNHTKIDNLVQIGHNCQIGNYVYIAGSAGLSGSIKVEDGVIIAGKAGIADHVTLGKKSVILALTGVPSDTKEGTVYFGIPARPVREAHKINSALASLPELIKRVKTLEEINNK
ncbi:MAG: UDP-3-O-(3-hydroxymyristoyl)glucosamine N-acyltransferase [Spirochaetia bacterium]|nr:UDP-3-O-(3-hydroxymyristoyl)glucosamine N-acyltransferase [Spirochaetia bacterium]